jgi:hypothetical protein
VVVEAHLVDHAVEVVRVDGALVSTGTGTYSPAGVCTNRLWDKNNCNACGTVCPGAQTCVNGTCM